jgi:SNF2 family DNA or RNA helicase
LLDAHCLRSRFNLALSSRRCAGPRGFVIDWRQIRLVSLLSRTERIVRGKNDVYLSRDSPAALLAMVRSLEERALELREVVATFVFVLPKVVSSGPSLVFAGCAATVTRAAEFRDALLRRHGAALQEAVAPFYHAHIRQSIFFPDRKLVQFDSGKLQTLAVLLARLKREGHKCLIFTQMSKMLDILEVFLNIHSHSFVRLDGSTGQLHALRTLHALRALTHSVFFFSFLFC